MDENRKKLVEEWLKRAEDDEHNASNALKDHGGTPSLVCFLSQQMSEKHLKALLLSVTGDYPKTHDLNQLVALLKLHYPSVTVELVDDIIILGPFYVGTRYPADIPLEHFTWEEAEKAFKAAIHIKEFVMKNL